MILTNKTSTRTDKSSSSQERLISLSKFKDAILFRDVWPVLQSDWIAVYAAKGTTQCRLDPLRASVRVWLRETRLVPTSHRLASCEIVRVFRAALDLDTYPP